uniref:Uncharacterized protein n=1 Tax=Glossina austeni TaxID=7395 RepID=A0A1A9VVF4_GLOAU
MSVHLHEKAFKRYLGEKYIAKCVQNYKSLQKIRGFQDARNPQQPKPYQTALKNDFIASVDVLCNVFKSTGYDVAVSKAKTFGNEFPLLINLLCTLLHRKYFIV